MSPRARIYTLVGAIAAAAAGLVVARHRARRRDHPPEPLGPRPGKPPSRPTGRRRRGSRATSGRRVGRCRGCVALADRNPRSSFVRLNLGLALFWRRDDAAALTAWRQAKRAPAGHAVRPSARATSSTRIRRAACRSSSRASTGPTRAVRAADRPRRPPPGERPPAVGGAARSRVRRSARRRDDPDAQVAAARRPLRQGRPLTRVRAARPARAPLPACADGSLPPRPALDLARRLRPGAARAALALRRTRNPSTGREARLLLKRLENVRTK